VDKRRVGEEANKLRVKTESTERDRRGNEGLAKGRGRQEREHEAEGTRDARTIISR